MLISKLTSTISQKFSCCHFQGFAPIWFTTTVLFPLVNVIITINTETILIRTKPWLNMHYISVTKDCAMCFINVFSLKLHRITVLTCYYFCHIHRMMGGLERWYYLLKFITSMVELGIQFRNAEFRTTSLCSLSIHREAGIQLALYF